MGLDSQDAASALLKAGLLIKGEDDHLAKRHRVPGIKSPARFYTVSSRILTGEG